MLSSTSLAMSILYFISGPFGVAMSLFVDSNEVSGLVSKSLGVFWIWQPDHFFQHFSPFVISLFSVGFVVVFLLFSHYIIWGDYVFYGFVCFI